MNRLLIVIHVLSCSVSLMNGHIDRGYTHPFSNIPRPTVTTFLILQDSHRRSCVCLCFCLFARQSIHPSVCPSVWRLSVCPYVYLCLSVYMYVSMYCHVKCLVAGSAGLPVRGWGLGLLSQFSLELAPGSRSSYISGSAVSPNTDCFPNWDARLVTTRPLLAVCRWPGCCAVEPVLRSQCDNCNHWLLGGVAWQLHLGFLRRWVVCLGCCWVVCVVCCWVVCVVCCWVVCLGCSLVVCLVSGVLVRVIVFSL